MNTQPTPDWRKSSYSGPNNCVEVATVHYETAIRDSQNPEQGHLPFTLAEWGAFLANVKSDRF